jgi:Flp pilus assembly protein TadD
MVPQPSLSAAQNVLREIKTEIDGLYREIREHARQGDRQAELRALTRLAQLLPDEARAHFHRGALLVQMGKDEEAADALIASLINNRGNEELFNDTYEELERLSARHPENVHILHNLATFSVSRGRDLQSVEKYYRRIIAVQPEDAMAHLHLGYIYYEGGDDISAYRHLKRYLELEPQSEEREAIEQILGQLRPISQPAQNDENDDLTAT